MDHTAEADYREFVRASWSRLARTAYLLTGDVQEAEDLTCDALVIAYRRWDAIRADHTAYPYVRIVLVNLASTWRRKRRLGALPVSVVPDRGHDDPGFPAAAQRDALVRALRTLPTRMRATLVLRYLEDLSEADTAAALGCSVGTVKTQTHRGLARLRGPSRRAPTAPPAPPIRAGPPMPAIPAVPTRRCTDMTPDSETRVRELFTDVAAHMPEPADPMSLVDAALVRSRRRRAGTTTVAAAAAVALGVVGITQLRATPDPSPLATTPAILGSSSVPSPRVSGSSSVTAAPTFPAGCVVDAPASMTAVLANAAMLPGDLPVGAFRALGDVTALPVSHDGVIELVDLTSGGRTAIASALHPVADPGQYDGRFALWSERRHDQQLGPEVVRMWDRVTGRTTTVVAASAAESVSWPVLLTGGYAAYVTITNGNLPHVHLVDLASGIDRDLGEGTSPTQAGSRLYWTTLRATGNGTVPTGFAAADLSTGHRVAVPDALTKRAGYLMAGSEGWLVWSVTGVANSPLENPRRGSRPSIWRAGPFTRSTPPTLTGSIPRSPSSMTTSCGAARADPSSRTSPPV